MENRKFHVGSKVRTGVYVCGEWKPMSLGIITRRIDDQLTLEVYMGQHLGRRSEKNLTSGCLTIEKHRSIKDI
jgi:hypothetical protein